MSCANSHTWTPSGLIAMKLQVMNVSNLAEKRGGGGGVEVEWTRLNAQWQRRGCSEVLG